MTSSETSILHVDDVGDPGFVTRMGARLSASSEASHAASELGRNRGLTQAFVELANCASARVLDSL